MAKSHNVKLEDMYKRVVVKIGSGVLSKEGLFDAQRVRHIVEQVVFLNKSGVEVIMITSGAVATGRGLFSLDEGVDVVAQKQIFASIGQIKLMSFYAKAFERYGMICSQILVTKEDFRDRQHYFNMKKCLENLLLSGVVPVVNENDVIAITELLFTDNDELAGLIASQLNADAVIILTSVDGVLDGDPKDLKSTVIPRIDFFQKKSFEKYITKDRSLTGRGGMHTKFGIAKKLSGQGISTHIANGKRKNVIRDIAKGYLIGTMFVPEKKVSATKRRIAYSEGLARGAVYVNACAEKILLSREVASVLPVGIVRVEGEFERGDIVEIRNEKKEKLGFGIARYGSEKAREARGKKNMRAFIHYDHMFLTEFPCLV